MMPMGEGGTMDSSQDTDEPGVGGTMDSSSAEGLREAGPLNKLNIADFMLGIGIAMLAAVAYKAVAYNKIKK